MLAYSREATKADSAASVDTATLAALLDGDGDGAAAGAAPPEDGAVAVAEDVVILVPDREPANWFERAVSAAVSKVKALIAAAPEVAAAADAYVTAAVTERVSVSVRRRPSLDSDS